MLGPLVGARCPIKRVLSKDPSTISFDFMYAGNFLPALLCIISKGILGAAAPMDGVDGFDVFRRDMAAFCDERLVPVAVEATAMYPARLHCLSLASWGRRANCR